MNHFKKGLAFVLSVLLMGGVCFALFLSVNRDAPYSTVGLFVAAASGKLQRGDLNGDGKISIADIVLLAQYVAGWEVSFAEENQPQDFTVTFQDWNGTVLKTAKVELGKDAVPPTEPTRDGYTFTGWSDSYKAVSADLIIIAQYEENGTDPALSVANIKAYAGATHIAVPVSVRNNPGILAMECVITYDEEALALESVTKGSAFSDYTFTAPKNRSSGCRAAWNINDLPDPVLDGESMILYFSVSASASSGNHMITVTCPSGGAFDGLYNVVELTSGLGSIIVS